MRGSFRTERCMNTQTINKRLKIIDDLNKELNVLKEQYEEALENDPQYQRVQERLEEIKAEVKEQKQKVEEKVEQKSSYLVLKEEIKEKKTEIKENKEILSVELVEFYRDTGQIEFEDDEGNVKKLKFSVRLVG